MQARAYGRGSVGISLPTKERIRELRAEMYECLLTNKALGSHDPRYLEPTTRRARTVA